MPTVWFNVPACVLNQGSKRSTTIPRLRLRLYGSCLENKKLGVGFKFLSYSRLILKVQGSADEIKPYICSP